MMGNVCGTMGATEFLLLTVEQVRYSFLSSFPTYQTKSLRKTLTRSLGEMEAFLEVACHRLLLYCHSVDKRDFARRGADWN